MWSTFWLVAAMGVAGCCGYILATMVAIARGGKVVVEAADQVWLGFPDTPAQRLDRGERRAFYYQYSEPITIYVDAPANQNGSNERVICR